MKKFIFTISLVSILLFINSSLYAHKEWVHQHQVRQAYLLLKQQLGFDIAILQNHFGFWTSPKKINGYDSIWSALLKDKFNHLMNVDLYEYVGEKFKQV